MTKKNLHKGGKKIKGGKHEWWEEEGATEATAFLDPGGRPFQEEESDAPASQKINKRVRWVRPEIGKDRDVNAWMKIEEGGKKHTRTKKTKRTKKAKKNKRTQKHKNKY